MPRYDLSLSGADYAQWTGAPRRSLIICSHPRSGSTMLGEAIAFAGGLGCPLEYLHRGFRPALAERWNAPDLDRYIMAMHRHRTEPNGTFSIKLFWQDIAEIWLEQRPDFDATWFDRPPDQVNADDYRAIATMLAAILPNPEFVYLYRRDSLRQAVSSLIATQAGVWRLIGGETDRDQLGAAEYDYDRIMALLAFGEFSHGHWRGFFAANGITPRVIAYEDLVADYAGIVGTLLTEMGAKASTPALRRMRRQSNGLSDAMMLRFLQENMARQAT